MTIFRRVWCVDGDEIRRMEQRVEGDPRDEGCELFLGFCKLIGGEKGFVGRITSGNAQSKPESSACDGLADTTEADESELFIA